jgi:hypothetical protein
MASSTEKRKIIDRFVYLFYAIRYSNAMQQNGSLLITCASGTPGHSIGLELLTITGQ